MTYLLFFVQGENSRLSRLADNNCVWKDMCTAKPQLLRINDVNVTSVTHLGTLYTPMIEDAFISEKHKGVYKRTPVMENLKN